MKQKVFEEIKSYFRLCAYALLVLYFFSNYIMASYRIEGNSMNPLLHHGERVLSNRLIYKSTSIKRGDVVVFNCPSEPYKYFIKRVIGLPGEHVTIQDGVIYIENRRVDDFFVPENFRSHENLNPVHIPMGHYFVAGDHRNISSDSRVWAIQTGQWPFVPERYIKGKIIFKIWPLTSLGPLESVSLEMMTQSAGN